MVKYVRSIAPSVTQIWVNTGDCKRAYYEELVAAGASGANPRDTAQDTSKGRGWDMNRCRKLLFECGFSHLLCGDDKTRIPLTYDYLIHTDWLI